MKYLSIRRLALSTLATGVCLAISSPPAHGGLCLWSGLGNDARFTNQSNWAPDPVPGAVDRAAFDVPGTLDVTFPAVVGNLDLLVLDGALTFRTDPASVARNCYVVTGDTFIESGSLEIAGLDLLVANHLFVDNGGALTVAFDDTGPFGRGSIDVGNALVVGAFDEGTVSIEKCGTLFSTHAFVAEWPGSVATVRIDEVGSAWLIGSDTFLGDFGDALLEVRNGGMALFGSSLGLANQPGSAATVIVDGPGSTLSVWDTLQVGRNGDGAFVLTGGAELITGNADLGAFTGSGSVIVDGPGTRWTAGTDTRIGRDGSGTMTICDGAMVEMAHVRIGDNDFASGSVYIDCPDSRWSLTDALWVGRRGAGGLTIAHGARVASIYAALGREAPGIGSVTVLGDNAQWEIDQTLAIGGSPSFEGGAGSLTILSDGAVEVGTTMRIWSDGSVLLSGGTLTATHIDHARYGTFSFTGGTLHTDMFEGNLWNDGGTLAPGRDVGQSAIDDFDSGCVDPDWLTGQMMIDGWFAQTAGVLEIDLLSNANRHNDRVDVLGDAYLDGDLVVHLLGGFVPDPLDMFVILEADTIVGAFDNAPVTVSLDDGSRFSVVYHRTPGNAQVRLTGFVPAPLCPTDLTGDGRSGFEDLMMLLNSWGACSHCAADLDGDGVVGYPDLGMIIDAWGDCS